MVWVKLDENAPHHPKLRKVGPEAAWLWVAGLAHANRFVTDGFIADDDLVALYPFPGWTPAKLRAMARDLVREGLWTPVPGGFSIHDYAVYQERAMRSAVEDRREYERTKKANQRANSKAKHGEKAPSREMSSGDTRGHVPGDTSGCPALPTRPDPTRPDPSLGALPACAGAPEGAREGESTRSAPPEEPRAPMRLPTEEPLRPLAYPADELLSDLERASGLRFSMPLQHKAELNRVLRDLSAQGRPIDRESTLRVAGHLAGGHTAPAAGGRPWVPSATSLRGQDGAWGRLVALTDEAHGCARCRAPVAPPGAPEGSVIPLRPEAPHPLLLAFLEGAGGAVPGVPSGGQVAAEAEKVLTAAGGGAAAARRMGALAAGPAARWTSLRRFVDAGRAPTVQELNACGGEGFTALWSASQKAPPAALPAPRPTVERIVPMAEALRGQTLPARSFAEVRADFARTQRARGEAT